MRVFVLLLEGKANLKHTGAITLPSDDDIEQAPADLKERLLAIESVDLSGLKNLGGKWACFKFEYMFGRSSRLCVCVCGWVGGCGWAWVWDMYRAMILFVVRYLTLHLS